MRLSALRAYARAASSGKSLKETVFEQIPGKQKELKEFNATLGEKTLGNVTVGQVRGAHAPSPSHTSPPARLLR